MKRIISIACVFLSTAFFSSCYGQTVSRKSEEFVTATVIGKECVTEYHSGNPEMGISPKEETFYLVYTNKGVFKIENSLISCQFSGSDIYDILAKDRVYKFKVFSWNVPSSSMYRNITGVYSFNNKPLSFPEGDKSKDTLVVKVTDKECIDDQYFIYTDEGTFKIEDLFGDLNGSNLYNMMKEGEYYRIKTFNVYNGILPSYQDIIEVEALN